MKRWAKWFGKNRSSAAMPEEHALLLDELHKAKNEWIAAVNRLEYVVGQDQIDYAIYLLEAAEKRYDMLLKHAKRIRLRVYAAPVQAGDRVGKVEKNDGGA